jgi:adenine-specific DNA-methyltransferase
MAAIDESTESRREAMQAAIDARKTLAERNRLGQFATPNALAVEIAQYVDSLLGPAHPRVQFADPSIGTGSFFSAALNLFGGARIEQAVGVELDPAFCEAARELWSGCGLQMVQGDFTKLLESGSLSSFAPDLILANPPYVRHHHFGREEKERLQNLTRAMTGIEVNGLAGLYVYFVLLATAWMRENGFAAWLIPSEFMDVNYGASLKKLLTERVTLLRVHRFNPADVQFNDALVSSAVLVFRKATPKAGHEVEFTFGGTLQTPKAKQLVSLDELRASRKWTSFPAHEDNDRRSTADSDAPTLADLFRIQRGIATGSNDFFVLTRADAKSHGIPARYLRSILPSPRRLTQTVVEADEDGYALTDPQLCVIDCDLPEHQVEERFPQFWAYLQTAEKLGIRNGYLVNKRSPWYSQEKREPAPFLCTYMGRGTHDKQPFRFILNRSKAICTNLYLMLHPRPALARMLRAHPDRLAQLHEELTHRPRTSRRRPHLRRRPEQNRTQRTRPHLRRRDCQSMARTARRKQKDGDGGDVSRLRQ